MVLIKYKGLGSIDKLSNRRWFDIGEYKVFVMIRFIGFFYFCKKKKDLILFYFCD